METRSSFRPTKCNCPTEGQGAMQTMTGWNFVGGDLSISRGIPLADEKGIGALTLGGYLREVTQAYGPNEALVLREGDKVVRWTYDELWERSMEVARALVACGVGKG